MKPFRDDAELIAELRGLRPAPRPAFAAELDEQAAAGFPRPAPLVASQLGDIVSRLRALSPRRMLFSTGAAALAAVAVVTVVVLGNGSRSADLIRDGAGPVTTDQAQPGEGSTLSQFSKKGSLVPNQFSNGAPSAAAKPHPTPQHLHHGFMAGAASAAAGAEEVAAPNLEAEVAVPSQAPAPGLFAENVHHRDVEHSAEVVLGADPADVADDSAAVFDAVHAANGIVLRSSTVEGAAGKAGARFDLLVPSAKLADALAAFSAIDEVRSRHEATADITAPTVTVGEHLQDSEARIDGLLSQLAAAETESEREIVEAELDGERRRAASLHSRLAHLHHRTSFSRVSLRIETGAASTSAEEGRAWGIGDAFHDAGHILAVAAAVALVALAVLGPIALIALLAWLAQRAWVRRGRQRALG